MSVEESAMVWEEVPKRLLVEELQEVQAGLLVNELQEVPERLLVELTWSTSPMMEPA